MMKRFFLFERIPNQDPVTGRTYSDFHYEPVTEEVAFSAYNGCFGIFNPAGELIGDYFAIHHPKRDEVKASVVQTHNDFLGQSLYIGDLVLVNYLNSSMGYYLLEVVGFTNKQIRVGQYSTRNIEYATANLVPPRNVVKLPDNLTA